MFIPPIHPSQIAAPSREIYAYMGDDNIVAMMRDFYRELEKSPIRGMFSADMQAAADKSALFFIGLLGGPPLYHAKYGNPMMRARHMPFPINQAGRDEWLACFNRVLDQAVEKYSFPSQYLTGFREFLSGFSLWMMNSD